ESFGHGPNLRRMLLALVGGCIGMTVVFYTSQFYALFFLTQILKVEALTANLLLAAALLVSMPCYVLIGRLSDRVGRKKVIVLGCALAAISYFPAFRAITHFTNPALEHATSIAPVSVAADPRHCSFQFDPVGRKKFVSSCDIARAAL